MVRLWGNRDSHILLAGMQIGAPIMEGYLAITSVITYAFIFDPVILHLGIYPEDTTLPPLHKNKYAQGYSLVHCV